MHPDLMSRDRLRQYIRKTNAQCLCRLQRDVVKLAVKTFLHVCSRNEIVHLGSFARVSSFVRAQCIQCFFHVHRSRCVFTHGPSQCSSLAAIYINLYIVFSSAISFTFPYSYTYPRSSINALTHSATHYLCYTYTRLSLLSSQLPPPSPYSRWSCVRLHT